MWRNQIIKKPYFKNRNDRLRPAEHQNLSLEVITQKVTKGQNLIFIKSVQIIGQNGAIDLIFLKGVVSRSEYAIKGQE